MPFLFDPTAREDENRISKADVDQLPYLQNVCRESIRFIPTIPVTVRESVASDQLGGYHIPPATTIYLLANTIHRLPQYWGPSADEFDPDRWDNLPSSNTTNAFLPFMQGPRGCIGRKFAEVEIKIILCALLSRFRFERDYGVEDPEKTKIFRLALRPREGMSLRVIPIV